jgi:hypothetical protein
MGSVLGNRPARLKGVVLVLAWACVMGIAWAQDEAKPAEKPGQGVKAAEAGNPEAKQEPAAKPAAKTKRKGQLAAGGAPPKQEARPKAADPLVKNALQDGVLPEWPYHVRLKIQGGDGTPRNAVYYPGKTPFRAPILLMIHQTASGRSLKDFEKPIEELEGMSFAERLQHEGYAILLLDLPRGEAQTRSAGPREWQGWILDVQAAYRFLIDRHNRGELNLGSFGVLGLGDGGNLLLDWALTPGAGVSSQGRTSDLGVMVLISPLGEVHGSRLETGVQRAAPRLSLMIGVGERDAASGPAVQAVQAIVERQNQGRVVYFTTALNGAQLMQFQPGVTAAVMKFLEPLLSRVVEWEPRYLLEPVMYRAESIAATKTGGEEAAKAKGGVQAEAEKPKGKAAAQGGVEKAKEAAQPGEAAKQPEAPKK